MQSFATWIARHRKLVIWIWVFVLVGTVIASSKIGSDYNEDFKPPKSDSQQAYDMLTKNYPAQSGDAGQLVFRSDAGVKDPDTERRITATLAKIKKVEGVGTIVSPYSAEGAQQISPDGKTAFATITWTSVITQGNAKEKVDPAVKLIEEAGAPGLQVEGGGHPSSRRSRPRASRPNRSA